MAAVHYFLLVFFQLCFAAGLENGNLTLPVSTTAGDVVGVKRELDGKVYRVFAGIPYAEPPVGSLRFRDPIAKWSWEGLFHATSFGRSCPQNISDVDAFNPNYVVKIPKGAMEISEDCLTLNIYTPYVHVGNMTAGGLAVMVWVHGGGYQYGQGRAYDASALSVKGGVVVVTLNYRLGPLGFLFTGDDSAKGNYGLKDQQLALRWVRDNIMAFGGDPWRVSLFGQSDVFESLPLHFIAKDSRPLFQRMAVHSPKWQSEWSDNPNAEAFAELLGCSNKNKSLLVECLRSKTVEEILEANKKIVAEAKYSYVWNPVFNDDIFNKKPGDGIKHDFLFVFNSGDGSIGLDLLKESLRFEEKSSNLTTGVTAEQFDEWLSSYSDSSSVSELAISQHYLSNDITDEDFARMKAAIDIHLDSNSIRYNAEHLDVLKLNLSSIFMMVFDHRSWVNDKYPELDLVPHGEELSYVLGLPFLVPGVGEWFTSDERQLSYRMIKFWSNFAKTGDPNSDGTTNPPSNHSRTTWPEYGDSKKYLEVRLNEEEVGSDFRGEEVYFWNEYLPELNEAVEEFCPSVPTAGIVDECDEKVIVGENLGLALSPDQAEALIGTMIFVGVALLCLIVLVIAVAVGYKIKSESVGQMTELSAEKGAAWANHYEPTINSAVESGTQASTYVNLQVPLVHSIEINHQPDQNDSEDDEAGPLPEKRAIVDSDDDDISPMYGSVNKPRHSPEVSPEDHTDTADEDVQFPPPPDDWSTNSNEEQEELIDPDSQVDPPPEDASIASADTEDPGEEDADQDQAPSKGSGSVDISDVSADPSTEPADDEDTKM